MAVALSTSWNAFRYAEGTGLILEIQALGFQDLELSFSLTGAIVNDIKDAVFNRQISVLSLHNYCPIPEAFARPEALPDAYSMASSNEGERQSALHYTKITIDTARQLGAKAVILHCGRVEIPDRTRVLIDLYNQGLKDTEKFQRLKDAALKERQEATKPFLENTLRSLGELNTYSAKLGIKLGIENRFYIREIPSWEEIGILLEEFKNSNILYWHDTGHAQVMERLGVAQHLDYLKSYSESMAGIHLHDIVGCQDHRAPFSGEFDFRGLLPYVKKETLKVIEAHYPATAEELKSAKMKLESLFE